MGDEAKAYTRNIFGVVMAIVCLPALISVISSLEPEKGQQDIPCTTRSSQVILPPNLCSQRFGCHIA